MEKLVELHAVPRVGETYEFFIQESGADWRIVKEVTHCEDGKIIVSLGEEKNEDGSDLYSDDEDLSLEINDYKKSGWKLKSLGKNRKHKPGHR